MMLMSLLTSEIPFHSYGSHQWGNIIESMQNLSTLYWKLNQVKREWKYLQLKSLIIHVQPILTFCFIWFIFHFTNENKNVPVEEEMFILLRSNRVLMKFLESFQRLVQASEWLYEPSRMSTHFDQVRHALKIFRTIWPLKIISVD